MLPIGARAPEFALPDQDGETVSLSDLLDEGTLILYFFDAVPPGNVREARAFRGLYEELVRAGFALCGVSPQPPETHRAFRAKYSLRFQLLSDQALAVARSYDIIAPFGMRVRRATFLIDRFAIVRDAILEDLFISRHNAFVRAALTARHTKTI